MEKIWKWFMESDRYKHFIGGIVIGLLSNDIYCAALAGIGIAGALEFKDWQWGGKPDVIDFSITIIGVGFGYAVRYLVLKCIF